MDARKRFGRDTHEVIGACIEVHRHLGPGLLESAYEECVAHEMELRGMRFVRQPVLPLVYKERRIQRAYQPDFVVGGRVMLEIKALQALLAVHAAQLRTYMKLQRLEVGLLVNFNVPALREQGIRRVIFSSPPCLPVSPD